MAARGGVLATYSNSTAVVNRLTSNGIFDQTLVAEVLGTARQTPAQVAANPPEIIRLTALTPVVDRHAAVGDVTVTGSDGNDTIIGGAKNDELYGGAGDDTLQGDAPNLETANYGDDYIDGGDGNDNIFGEGGSDVIYGGAGNDKIDADAPGLLAEQHGDDFVDHILDCHRLQNGVSVGYNCPDRQTEP